MELSKIWIIVVVVLVAACLCLGCICVVGGLAFFAINNASTSTPIAPFEPFEPLVSPTPFPFPQRTSPGNLQATPEPPDMHQNQPTVQPPDDSAFQTLKDLQAVAVPTNDPIGLAERYEGKTDIPATVPFPGIFKVGDNQDFWVSNTDTNENRQVSATLGYVTDHAYFWVEDGVNYSDSDLASLAKEFNDKIYPTDREFFGSEWNPGIDNDPRVYILYARGLGSNIAGYFSSADLFHPKRILIPMPTRCSSSMRIPPA